MTCIFCSILSSQSPASFVYQDNLCAAFMDIHPVNPGHVLVVPRTHAAFLSELDPATAGHLMQVAQRVDTALRRCGLRCEGVNLYLADGRPAGQDIMHVHLHVFPRFHGDGHHLRFGPSYLIRPSSAELEMNAVLLREQFQGES